MEWGDKCNDAIQTAKGYMESSAKACDGRLYLKGRPETQAEANRFGMRSRPSESVRTAGQLDDPNRSPASSRRTGIS
jgi:hypothetical protein